MFALLKRDLYLALYSSSSFFFFFFFFILALIILPFLFGTYDVLLPVFFKGTFFFFLSLSILLTMERIFNADYEDGNLDIILQQNPSIEAVIISKYITHWIVYCLPLFIVLPILSFLFYVSLDSFFLIFLNLFFGSLGMVFIVTFVSALTLGAKRTIFLKAIIVIPLFVPFLIFGTNLESWPILLALSMMSFVLSMYVSAYGLRLYVE